MSAIFILTNNFDSRINSVEKGIVLAHNAMEKRLDSMNEFREALKDQNSRFITRTEFDLMLKDIQDLKESRAELSGKASQQSVNVAYVISVAGIILSAIGVIHGFLP